VSAFLQKLSNAGANTEPTKVPFRTLFDTQYIAIKKCLCEGVANLFKGVAITCVNDVHTTLRKSLFVTNISETGSPPLPGATSSTSLLGATKILNPEITKTVDKQIGNIMTHILKDPSPQLRVDIRRHFGDGCQPRAGPPVIRGGDGGRAYTRKKYHKIQ
jgi:hypothetical protein